MKKTDLSRRDFSKLTMAAFGGMVAGTAIGCGGGEETEKTAPENAKKPEATLGEETSDKAPAEESKTDVALLLEEPHVCRGLNTCKSKGAGKENACAGQGTCATAKEHSCHAANTCKGQGGCESTAGINSCKETGACNVPLMEDTWTKVRAAFEKEMAAQKKEVGAAPAAG